MKKFYSYLMMALMALTSTTLFTGCDKDEMEAWTLEGTWTGYIESYYRDRWGISGDYYRTTMFFDKRGTYGGTGYEVDYSTRNRYVDYYYCEFDWTVVNGEIRIRYADSWDDVYIYDYRLNSRYFEGYMDDGTHRDIYFNLQSDNDFDWDGYRRRYRYAPTRGMNDDGKRFHASGIFAEIKKEASK